MKHVGHSETIYVVSGFRALSNEPVAPVWKTWYEDFKHT